MLDSMRHSIKVSELQEEETRLQRKANDNRYLEMRTEDTDYEVRVGEHRSIISELDVTRGKLLEVYKEQRAAFEKEDAEAQVAMAKNVDDVPGSVWTPELKEFRALGQKVNFADYMIAAIDGRPVEGAAAEYNRHVFQPQLGRRLPLGSDADREEMLAFKPEELERVLNAEHRAAITGANVNAGASVSFADRLFGSGEAAFMNASFPAVGPGDHTYPIVSGTGIANYARDGAETPAGGITINTVSNVRLQHSYEILGEDENRIPNLANQLVGDLRSSIMAGLDNYVIDRLVAGLTVTPAVSTTVETLAAFMSRIGAVVDGKGARNIGDVRALVNTAVGAAANNNTSAFSLLSGLSLASGGSHFAELWDLASPTRLRGSAHLQEVGGTGLATSDAGVLFAKTGSSVRRLIVPIWRRGQLLRDTGVGQLKAQTVYTIVMYTGVELVATDMHRYGNIHTK